MRSFLASAALGAAVLALALPARADLVTTGIDRFGDGDTVVRYAQTHHGIPVIGRGAAERFSASGERLADLRELVTDLPSTSATLTADDAATIAGAAPPDAHLVIWPTYDRGARLAYAVVPPYVTGIPHAWRTIVDAQTGEILERRDVATSANARVYTFNPVTTPNVTIAKLPIDPQAGQLTNDFIEAFNCIDKKSLHSVDGEEIHVCDLVQTAAADANGDFVYDPSDVPGALASRTDVFSEVAIYYHTGKAYQFFRELQGDPTAQISADKPLRLVANLQVSHGLLSGNPQAVSDPNLTLDTFQNAFFAPAAGGLGGLFQSLYGFQAGALWFGQGPRRDYAYDGDVVYHEFTHSMIDNTIHLVAWHLDKYGAIDAPGAMNEALADYFSCAITGDPNVGEYASADLGAAGAIRTLDNQDTCPNLVGEVHADSTLFSGGLWEARASLPENERADFDRGIYKAIRQSPGRGDLGFEDLTNLFLQVLRSDLPAGATALEAAMTRRKVLANGDGCARIFDYPDAGFKSSRSGLGFTAPGIALISSKGVAPGLFQLRSPIPAKAASVTVTFSEGTITSSTPNGTPFTPVLLAKLGTPITWSEANGNDADLKTNASASSATITLPAGTTASTIYLQIANTGSADGAYDRIFVSFRTADGTVVKPPSTEAPDAGPTTIVVHSGGGCGITPGASMFGSGGVLVGLAGLSVAMRRKKRAEAARKPSGRSLPR